jgi:ABC-type polar amino acid transport system ATPase subunit
MDLNHEQSITKGEKMNLVEVHNLHKHYGTNHILKGVNLEVKAGDVKAILGPSGSGKSTLLRLIALLEPIDQGSIRVDGRVLAKKEDGHKQSDREKDLAILRRGIGMVFQKFNLFPHLNAIDNVALALTTVQKMNRQVALDKSAEMLKRVGLADRMKFFPSELSGGQQQRVAIARALVLEPKLMLFDEPTSALDPELVREVLNVIEQLASDGMTMLIVTHEVGFARKIANEVVMFDEGEIVETGTPEEIFTNAQHARTRKFLEHVL